MPEVPAECGSNGNGGSAAHRLRGEDEGCGVGAKVGKEEGEAVEGDEVPGREAAPLHREGAVAQGEGAEAQGLDALPPEDVHEQDRRRKP